MSTQLFTCIPSLSRQINDPCFMFLLLSWHDSLGARTSGLIELSQACSRLYIFSILLLQCSWIFSSSQFRSIFQRLLSFEFSLPSTVSSLKTWNSSKPAVSFLRTVSGCVSSCVSWCVFQICTLLSFLLFYLDVSSLFFWHLSQIRCREGDCHLWYVWRSSGV